MRFDSFFTGVGHLATPLIALIAPSHLKNNIFKQKGKDSCAINEQSLALHITPHVKLLLKSSLLPHKQDLLQSKCADEIFFLS